MTKADTINADLHEMEGKCVHINEALYVHCYWDSNAYYLTRECLDCDDNVAIVDVFRREATFMDAIFPEWDAIPPRLSDGTYILGLVERYNLTVVPEDYGWRVFPRFLKNSNFHSKDKFVKHAIALAAIQRWKESGG